MKMLQVLESPTKKKRLQILIFLHYIVYNSSELHKNFFYSKIS